MPRRLLVVLLALPPVAVAVALVLRFRGRLRPSPAAPATPPPTYDPGPAPQPAAPDLQADVPTRVTPTRDGRTRLRLQILADQVRSRSGGAVADEIERFLAQHGDESEEQLRPAALELLERLRSGPDVSSFVREALVLPDR